MSKSDTDYLRCYMVIGVDDMDFVTFYDLVESALASGVTTLQYREKNKTFVEKIQVANKLRQLTHKYQAKLIINDDINLALAVKADGVHVGQKDDNIHSVLKKVPNNWIVGYSCQTLEQVLEANKIEGISYLGIGPIYATTSKLDASEPIGIDQLACFQNISQHPIVAIGGITRDNLAQLKTINVSGIAGISIFKQPRKILKDIIKEIKEG